MSHDLLLRLSLLLLRNVEIPVDEVSTSSNFWVCCPGGELVELIIGGDFSQCQFFPGLEVGYCRYFWISLGGSLSWSATRWGRTLGPIVSVTMDYSDRVSIFRYTLCVAGKCRRLLLLAWRLILHCCERWCVASFFPWFEQGVASGAGARAARSSL